RRDYHLPQTEKHALQNAEAAPWQALTVPPRRQKNRTRRQIPAGPGKNRSIPLIENFENILERVILRLLRLGHVLFLQGHGLRRGALLARGPRLDGRHLGQLLRHLVKAGGDDGDPDLVVQRLVEGGAEDGE
ncbi:NADH:flavin oxidoreductase/NADH oxidase N-terminal domain-containing protein, partial [Dysosmobacter welbionis]